MGGGGGPYTCRIALVVWQAVRDANSENTYNVLSIRTICHAYVDHLVVDGLVSYFV